MEDEELKKYYAAMQERCLRVRQNILLMIERSGRGHIGGSLSVVEILVSLYNSYLMDPPETRANIIYSKAHACEAFYAIMNELYPDKYDLNTYAQNGSLLGCHVHENPKLPLIQFSGGSLGHGLGVAAGMAFASLLLDKPRMTYCVLGDGECMEGSVWEAAMFAKNYGLRNLVAVIDRNNEMTLDTVWIDPLKEKFESFGWRAVVVKDGNNVSEVQYGIYQHMIYSDTKPTAIICQTKKGKGISFMENEIGWHHAVPKGEKLAQAKKELGL